MKPSIYNSYFNFSDGIQMIYNAYTDMFVLLRSKIIVDSQNIISTETTSPEFYENAINSGCVIENKVDEVENVRNEIIRANENDDFFI